MIKWLSNLEKNLDVLILVAASFLGIILHHVGMLPEKYLISLILLLLALHALHQAVRDEEESKKLLRIEERLGKELEIELIGPSDLLKEGEEFALRNRGEMWWFNTPLGFRRPEMYEKLLKPAIESSKTKKIYFILRPEFKKAWDEEAAPKIASTKGKEKVVPPIYCDIKEDVSFKMIDIGEDKEVKEAHLTFPFEPFIMRDRERNIYHPRYVLYIKKNCELIPRLKELFLKYKLEGE